MSKYAWVALGMFVTAVGGSAGTWFAVKYVFGADLNQPPEVVTNLIGYGGVFSSLLGGLISLAIGRTGDRNGRLLGLITFACGLAIAIAISPTGTLIALNPLSLLILIGIWPFALLGGSVMFALLCVSVWAMGRKRTDVPNKVVNPSGGSGGF